MVIGVDIRTLMDAQYSGVSEYTLNLLHGILKNDSVNEYRFFYNSLHDLSGTMPVFDYPNVKTLAFRYPNKVLNYGFFKFLNYPKADQMLGGCDLFFMPHLNFVSLSPKTKSVLTVHDLSFLRYPEFFSVRKNFWHRMINVKKLFKKFDHLVAVSENTKRDIVELTGTPAEKVSVIYSGLNLEPALNNSAATLVVKEKYQLPEKFIFYLGTIEPRKNISGLIEAYNLLRRSGDFADYKLVIAGASGWRTQGIMKTFEDSPFKNDIKFLGYVPKEDNAHLYSLASLFVYPSFYEGFGFPILEAFACGTPVITSAVSSMPEIAENVAILINPYNYADIAMAMSEALKNPILRQKMADSGRLAAQRYTWDSAAKSYLQIFKNIV